MFRNFYQGGPYLEIFSTQDKTLLSKWKLPPRGRKEFDNEARTYVYCLQGTTSTSKIELRKESRKGAGLFQPYLMFQVKVPHAADFSIEISVMCYSQNRRIFFSTSQKTTRAAPALRAVVPLSPEMRGKWNNLCIDVPDLVSGFWKSETFQCLDSISVGGTFRLRRIFTMKHYGADPITPAQWEKMFYSRIPKSLQLPKFLPQQMILITIESIGYDPSQGKETIPGNESNLSKISSLSGRYSTESLPLPVTYDFDMQLSRTHSRSKSYSECNPDAKGGYLIVNSSKQNRHYRRPSQDENKVSAVHPHKTFKTVRHSFSRRDLHKGDLNHETRTLISELGRSLSSSPASSTSNQSNPVCEYQCGDLEVTGKKIKSSHDAKKISATRKRCKVREKSRPLEHQSSRSSSAANHTEDLTVCTAKFDESIRSDQHKNEPKYAKSAIRVQHSESGSSSANDGSQSGCEASEESDASSPDQNVKFECEEISQCSPKKHLWIDFDSAEMKICEPGSSAEQLSEMFAKLSTDEPQKRGSVTDVKVKNEMFAKLSMDELQKHGGITDVMVNICDEMVFVDPSGTEYICDSTSFDPSSYNK